MANSLSYGYVATLLIVNIYSMKSSRSTGESIDTFTGKSSREDDKRYLEKYCVLSVTHMEM